MSVFSEWPKPFVFKDGREVRMKPFTKYIHFILMVLMTKM